MRGWGETHDHLVFEPAHRPGDEQTDSCTADDIQGVMNADVNPGVGYYCGDPVEKKIKPTKELRKKKGRSKDVDRVGRGKRGGGITVGQQPNVR